MRIRHQVELPTMEEAKEEAKGLMRKIRDNKWTPVIVMGAAVVLLQSRSSNQVTVNIHNNTTTEEEI